MNIQHNFVFKKESIVNELADIIEMAKDGIQQLQGLYKTNKKGMSNEKIIKSAKSF